MCSVIGLVLGWAPPFISRFKSGVVVLWIHVWAVHNRVHCLLYLNLHRLCETICEWLWIKALGSDVKSQQTIWLLIWWCSLQDVPQSELWHYANPQGRSKAHEEEVYSKENGIRANVGDASLLAWITLKVIIKSWLVISASWKQRRPACRSSVK